MPASRVGRGIGEQVALARRDSAHRGGQHVGTGKALTREMPHTLAALTWGRVSEWRATLLVRETAYLSAEERDVVATVRVNMTKYWAFPKANIPAPEFGDPVPVITNRVERQWNR